MKSIIKNLAGIAFVIIIVAFIFVAALDFYNILNLDKIDNGYEEVRVVNVYEKKGTLGSRDYYVKFNANGNEVIKEISYDNYMLLEGKIGENVYIIFMKNNSRIIDYVLDEKGLAEYKSKFKSLELSHYINIE